MTETRHSSRIPLLVLLPVVLIVIVWLLPGTHFPHQEHRQGEFPLAAATKRIKLRIENGNVQVVVGEAGFVRFRAKTLRVAQDEEAFQKLRAQDFTLVSEFAEASGELELSTPPFPAGLEAEGGRGFRGMRQFDVHLEVPAHLPVDVECKLGHVSAEHLSSPITIRTGGGNVLLKVVTGKTEIYVEHGDVIIDQHRGDLDVFTRNGKVLVLMSEVLKPVKLVTLAGDVKCTVAKHAAFELEARSLKGGGVISDFALPRVTLGDEGQGMRGLVNGGGPRLEAESAKGTVSVLVQR